jgi:hypothetical protein
MFTKVRRVLPLQLPSASGVASGRTYGGNAALQSGGTLLPSYTHPSSRTFAAEINAGLLDHASESLTHALNDSGDSHLGGKSGGILENNGSLARELHEEMRQLGLYNGGFQTLLHLHELNVAKLVQFCTLFLPISTFLSFYLSLCLFIHISAYLDSSFHYTRCRLTACLPR